MRRRRPRRRAAGTLISLGDRRADGYPALGISLNGYPARGVYPGRDTPCRRSTPRGTPPVGHPVEGARREVTPRSAAPCGPRPVWFRRGPGRWARRGPGAGGMEAPASRQVCLPPISRGPAQRQVTRGLRSSGGTRLHRAGAAPVPVGRVADAPPLEEPAPGCHASYRPAAVGLPEADSGTVLATPDGAPAISGGTFAASDWRFITPGTAIVGSRSTTGGSSAASS